MQETDSDLTGVFVDVTAEGAVWCSKGVLEMDDSGSESVDDVY
jgi:hypothetical protein